MISLVQFSIVLFVTLGSWTYGYCSAIIATTLGQPTFLHYLKLDVAANANALIGAINALFSVGGFLGCLACLFIADAWGRKRTILFGAMLAAFGSALQAGSVHIAMFIIARLITGISVGILVILVPLYQSEIAPPRIRGFLVGMHGVGICFGYLSSSWVGFAFYFVNAAAAQWRIPLAIQAFPPILLGIGVLFIPESPRWLLTKDRTDEAFLAFKASKTESVDETDEAAIQEEFHLLSLQIHEEMKKPVTLAQLFTRPALRKRCLVALLTMAVAQGTGTLVINNYAALLYRRLGFDTKYQLLLGAAWLSMSPFGNIFNSLVVDKVGRTRMLLIGICGDIVALTCECISVAIFQKTGERAPAKAAVFFLFLHLAFFSSFIDATTYIYVAEIFPNPVRARGLSIGVCGLFLSSLAYLAAAPTAFEQVGWRYYLVFLIVSVTSVPIIWVVFPETKGTALEDIAEMFSDGIILSEKEEILHQRFKESRDHTEEVKEGYASALHVERS